MSCVRRLAALLVLLALVAGCGDERPAERRRTARARPNSGQPSAPLAPVPAGFRRCERVIDGDTVVLDGGERVRLIGVDTPEVHHPSKPVEYFGRQASAFTESLVEGKLVRLEYDQTRRDRFRRTLAYLRLEDGTFVNLEVVRRGYGFAYTQYPFRYMDEFRAAEREARTGGAGLWAHRDSIGRPA
ncbi:MAG: thermonuclease family protein [Candidatus Eisenbacteria bacterium]|nr:thermonuclease family protein [Candidatus Eisenbacteria bacterium]